MTTASSFLLNDINYTTLAQVVVASVVGLGTLSVTAFVLWLRRLSNSVGLAKPTPDQLNVDDEKDNPRERCALFRHLPHLADQLAWRSLGASRSTPVHICSMEPLSSRNEEEEENNNNNGNDENKKNKVQVLLKREDLISLKYGGNKVRTLQHQLAICEARRERGESAFRQLVSVGSGGSNQVLATVVHSQALGWTGRTTNNGDDNNNATIDGKDNDKDTNDTDNRVNVCWFEKDEPDLDNTLNMLGVLSFPNVGFTFDWGQSSASTLRAFFRSWMQTDFVPMQVGGNCPSGVLGQVSGILELAEQIVAQQSPDPERIYLPVGSACTISGLIVGTVLVRHLGLQALQHPDFKIVGCNVDDTFAMLDRTLNFHLNPIFSFLPLTISHTVRHACRALHTLGGPNLEAECVEFLKTSVEMRANADVVGLYGGHSELSRKAAQCYDETGVVTDYCSGQTEKGVWVCGHFVSKALQPLLRDLEVSSSKDSSNDVDTPATKKYMLWVTKSAVQPRGNENEWEKMLRQNKDVLEWANAGKAESELRPGQFSSSKGDATDYRKLMTSLAADKCECIE